MQVKIEKVSEYNRRARERYHKDIDAWNPENGGFPYLGFYIYYKEETQEEYKRGVVVSWETEQGGRGSRFFNTWESAKMFYKTV